MSSENKEITHLETWTEYVGRFVKLEIGESYASVVLTCGSGNITLSFPLETLESQTLQRELSTCEPGALIALIATGETSRPLLVRKIRT